MRTGHHSPQPRRTVSHRQGRVTQRKWRRGSACRYRGLEDGASQAPEAARRIQQGGQGDAQSLPKRFSNGEWAFATRSEPQVNVSPFARRTRYRGVPCSSRSSLAMRPAATRPCAVIEDQSFTAVQHSAKRPFTLAAASSARPGGKTVQRLSAKLTDPMTANSFW